jgi:hypothetical protein
MSAVSGAMRKVKHIASTTTVLSRALAQQPARISIPAPSAALEHTLLSSAVIDILFPIVTPLRYQKWYELLEEAGILEEFAEVPEGLCNGFGLGLDHVTLTSTFSPPNHYTSREHHNFLIEKYSSEILLNRISPGYPPHIVSLLVGHYRTAPIGVIERELGGKLRAIIDHSFPRSDPNTFSMNSCIDSSLFQCEWGTFSECYLLVADAPEGTEVGFLQTFLQTILNFLTGCCF